MARRIAVVGSGIAGLSAAHALAAETRVTLFEAGSHFGGHTHTVDVSLEGKTQGVDTGFLVFNERTYPRLIRLFADLEVSTVPSEMSFSVQVPDTGLEWSGSDLNTVFAQRTNLFKPGFWGMLADILRFNRLTTALALNGSDTAASIPVGEFLKAHRFGKEFRDWYFLPMIGCIWSCPTDQMLRFPMATLVRFCHNHGLLQIRQRPRWHTVRGGARHYVQKMLQAIPDARLNSPVIAVRRLGGEIASIEVQTTGGAERFDEVVLACHSDQSLALLGEGASPAERALLGTIRYHDNRALLHTDISLLPRRPLAWAAWNYERASDDDRERGAVCLHYLLNRLQPLPWTQPLIVSLNPARAPRPDTVLGDYRYAHPVFDASAIAAQQRLGEIQGRQHVWFCGAWTGYGFHEDGLRSGLAVADALRARWACAPRHQEAAA